MERAGSCFYCEPTDATEWLREMVGKRVVVTKENKKHFKSLKVDAYRWVPAVGDVVEVTSQLTSSPA